MPHGKLVQELGDRYFYDKLRNVYFIYEGELVLLCDWEGGQAFMAKNTRGDMRRVPSEFFTGYGVFKWPALGYRKLNDNVFARVSKGKDARPGIKHGNLSHEYSPLSQFLMDAGAVGRPSDWELMSAAFLPQYDTSADLPALFAGDKAALVLNEQLMIEPTLRDVGDQYDIMHRGSIIGCVNPAMEITAANAKNKQSIGRLLNVRN